MRVMRCDGCGNLADDPRGFSPQNATYGWFSIYVEANEDDQHLDACSWACVADVAMQRAVPSLPSTGETK
jgi:hypothetical protein